MSQSERGDVEARLAHLEAQEQRVTRVLELLAQTAAPAAKPGRDWDAYAAVIASLIGVLALAISGYTAYQQRQQLRAQMWPRLQLMSSNVHRTFYVTNRGTGPARITGMRVTVGGALARTWADVAQAAGLPAEHSLVTSWISAAVISPAQEVIFAQPQDNDQSRAGFDELFAGKPHVLEVTLCYCSVLDECWVVHDSKGPARDTTRAVERCPIADAERFLQ